MSVFNPMKNSTLWFTFVFTIVSCSSHSPLQSVPEATPSKVFIYNHELDRLMGVNPTGNDDLPGGECEKVQCYVFLADNYKALLYEISDLRQKLISCQGR